MQKENRGILRAQEIYKDRPRRVKELKAEGKKIIGYLCIYPVIEMLTALDLVPYRIFGDIRESLTKVDACLPTVVCPFLRSILDLGLKGQYDFLDGVVMAHTCEVGEKIFHIWKTYLKLDYLFFIDTPHTTHKAAQEYHKELLIDFKKSLEAFTGKELTKERLFDAIKAHNEQRKLVRDLYELRKFDRPLISGVETLQVVKALMSIPVDEGNGLLREVISEVKERSVDSQKRQKRLLLWGSIIDDVAMLQLIEDLGVDLVMDDSCVGSRAYFQDTKLTEDPLDGLAYRYLVEIKCPRTFREIEHDGPKLEYMKDIETRFGYLGEFVKEWKVDGIILHALRYCDIHAYEIPAIRDYLDTIGVKSIYIEPDYNESALALLRTRIEAFIETIDEDI